MSDLAEKIGTEASNLVQALFNLGEMVTATQSVSEDTPVSYTHLTLPTNREV